MKRLLTSLKRQDGFTLVELMVVVAIIGLLSAVAIPNFKKYQAKAKMSEAKLQLASVYTAESAFLSDFNIFGACLDYMGYNPETEKASRYYAVGFGGGTIGPINATAVTSAINSGLQTAQCDPTTAGGVASPATTGISFYPAGKGTGASVVTGVTHFTGTVAQMPMLGTQQTSDDDADANADGMTFKVGAAGIIDGSFTGVGPTPANASSYLTIDNRKRVRVLRNGY